MNRVVARFADGRMVKGTTADFAPAKDQFPIAEDAAPVGTTPVEVRTKDLKALAGDPEYVEKKSFAPARPPAGRRIRVTYKDGEVLVGTTTGYQRGRPGFFLVPADSKSNIERCYVVAAAAREIGFL